MFSHRVLALFALFVAVTALPSTNKPAFPRPVTSITEEDIEDSPWFSFPMFGNLFAPIWKLFPSFADIGPKIVADDNKFQVIISVKDYKKEDLKVKIKGDFIFVQGSHEATKDDHDLFASQFFHTYSMPANASSSDVTAEITSDDYLIITALLNTKSNKDKAPAEKEVAITQSDKPYKEEKQEKITTEQAITDDDDDKKEPTTPVIPLEVTDKDNSIPHGNEVSP